MEFAVSMTAHKLSKSRWAVLCALVGMVVRMTAEGQVATSAPAGSEGVEASAARDWQPPRTSWGDPNIEGVYTNQHESNTPFERPEEFEGRALEEVMAQELAEWNLRRSIAKQSPSASVEEPGGGPLHWNEDLETAPTQAWLVVQPEDGHVPDLTREGLRRLEAFFATRAKREHPDSYKDLTLYDRCITRGVPGSMLPLRYGSIYQIVQAPGYVVIRYEMVHEARVIPLDGSPHVSSKIASYMGDARGRWDGDTLVLETKNFRADAAFRNSSEDLVITERFTPVSADTLRWEVHVDDPSTWEAPWAFAMPLKRDPSLRLFEYACHEGNLGLRNILSAARASDDEYTESAEPAPAATGIRRHAGAAVALLLGAGAVCSAVLYVLRRRPALQ